MPLNKVERTASFPDKEIFKYGVSLDGVPVKSVVLDPSGLPAPTPPYTYQKMMKGTVLMKSPDGRRMVVYDGSGAAKIEGILGESRAIWVNSTTGVEPAPMYYRGVVFATVGIVSFATYAADLVTKLSAAPYGCGFE
jgi:hypothetical protein